MHATLGGAPLYSTSHVSTQRSRCSQCFRSKRRTLGQRDRLGWTGELGMLESRQHRASEVFLILCWSRGAHAAFRPTENCGGPTGPARGQDCRSYSRVATPSTNQPTVQKTVEVSTVPADVIDACLGSLVSACLIAARTAGGFNRGGSSAQLQCKSTSYAYCSEFGVLCDVEHAWNWHRTPSQHFFPRVLKLTQVFPVLAAVI